MMIVAISFFDVRRNPAEEWCEIVHGQFTGSGRSGQIGGSELAVTIEYFFVHLLLQKLRN